MLGDSQPHTYWVVACQYTDELLEVLLAAAHCRITVDGTFVVLSGSTREFHDLVRVLLDDDDSRIKKFATLLVQTTPDVFMTLGRNMKSDGTIALRR